MSSFVCAMAMAAALNLPPAGVIAISEVVKYNNNDIIVLAAIESKFNQAARSHANAVGVMQLTPVAVKEVYRSGCVYPLPKKPDVTRLEDNVLIGACYFLQLSAQFPNVESAIAAYNAGPGAGYNLAALKPVPYETAMHVLKFIMLKRKVPQCLKN